MPNTVAIVTSRCFVLAKAINNIVIRPNMDHYGSKPVMFYDIHIDYIPEDHGNQNNSHRNGEGQNVVVVRVRGEQSALKLFKELVQQMREQMPDQVYLDKMVENILDGKKDIFDAAEEQEKVKVRLRKDIDKALRKLGKSKPTKKKTVKKKAKKKK